MRRACLVLLAAGLSGGCNCGDDAGKDAGVDAGHHDAGAIDSGQPDAGPVDAGPTDSGHPDAGPGDAGLPDGGPCLFPQDAGFPATLRFTADNQRAVWLNGVLLEDVASLGWPQVTTMTVTLSPDPTQPNVIAVLGTNTSSQAGEDRGVIADLTWNGPDGNPLTDAGRLLVSDHQWKTIDATGTDGGTEWTMLGFDDSSWAPATEEGENGIAPWGAVMGDSTSQWIWFYDSALAVGKPDLEPARFRRVFYVSAAGLPVNQPQTCTP